MLNPGVAYMLVSVLLFAVAVVNHYHGSHLSLPIADFVTILTTILPIASFINAFIYPNLLKEIASPNIVQRAIPAALQGLQAIITTMLATILAEGVVPSSALECVMARDWSALYNEKDGLSIGYIQETLHCCGFETVDDRSFPFPAPGGETCAEKYGRTLACRGPWKQAMQLHSGIGLAIIILVGALQGIGLLMMRHGTNWWTSLRSIDMKDTGNTEEPLLNGEDNNAERQTSSYGTA